MKVYLSPSDQINNLYADNLGTEQQYCTLIAKSCEKYLKEYGYEVKIGDNSLDETYTNRVAESNNWRADLHIPIHTNAGGNATGALVMIYDNRSGAVAEDIYNSLVSVTLNKNGLGVRTNTSLYEINATNAICIYCECEFHDKSDTAHHIVNNIDSFGKAIADGIKNYYGESSAPIPEPVPQPENVNVNVYYKARTLAHGWLPEVMNENDFAGFEGSPITDIAIKVDKGSIKYRVHVKGGGWLPYVTGYDLGDYQNGYAGNGTPIDLIECYYYTPDNIRPYKKAKYKVNNYPYQYDNETTNNQDGYAGVLGVNVTEFRIIIE